VLVDTPVNKETQTLVNVMEKRSATEDPHFQMENTWQTPDSAQQYERESSS